MQLLININQVTSPSMPLPIINTTQLNKRLCIISKQSVIIHRLKPINILYIQCYISSQDIFPRSIVPGSFRLTKPEPPQLLNKNIYVVPTEVRTNINDEWNPVFWKSPLQTEKELKTLK